MTNLTKDNTDIISKAYDTLRRLKGELDGVSYAVSLTPSTGDENADSYASALLDEVFGELDDAMTKVREAMDDLKLVEETIMDAREVEAE